MIELRHLFAQEDQEIYLSDHLATYIRWLSICKKALHRGPNKHEALKWYLVLTDTILATPNIRCSRVHTSALHIRGDFNTTRYLYTDVKLIQVQLIPPRLCRYWLAKSNQPNKHTYREFFESLITEAKYKALEKS